jgi:hypothetical protein
VVLPDGVRRRVNLTAAQVPDQIVEEFIEDAVAALFTQTGQTIDTNNCSASEAVAVKNLAVIYCACRATGGAASGMSFRIGDLSVSESKSNSDSGLSSTLQFLLDQVNNYIESMRGADFRVVTS